MKDIRNLVSRVAHNEIVWGICAALVISVAFFAMAKMNTARPSARSTSVPSSMSLPVSIRTRPFAEFRDESASADVRYMANWIADSGDAAGLPFVIVDKKGAKVYVFDEAARLSGASSVLLGSAAGDDSVPNIGLRPLEEVLPEERTTPAGRFVGQRGFNARGEDVVWVDYDAALSMHRVLTTHPEEKRLERLASSSHDDKRISYRCINVSVEFFEAHLQPLFASQRAIVYVLPEVKPIDQVFVGSYDVAAARGHMYKEVRRTPGSDALIILLLAMRSG